MWFLMRNFPEVGRMGYVAGIWEFHKDVQGCTKYEDLQGSGFPKLRGPFVAGTCDQTKRVLVDWDLSWGPLGCRVSRHMSETLNPQG